MDNLRSDLSKAQQIGTALVKELAEKDEDLVAGVPTLVDLDHEHPFIGDLRLPQSDPHPEVQIPDWYVSIKYRMEDDQYEVTVTQWEETSFTLDTAKEMKEKVREIIGSMVDTPPRADRYGSREREARLRQDAHGPY